MGSLDGIQEEIQRVAERVSNAVVGIGQRWGVGSGIVVGKDQVLTNAHNVRAEEVDVTFFGGRTATGRVAGADIDGDVAVISVDTGDIPAIEWTTEGPPQLGTPVFALADPGGRGLRLTLGFITGVERSFRGPRGRRITGSIEHDAPLLPGWSGGPIVDSEGRLLGLNTNRLGEGFYLAIPADQALRDQVDALARGESKERVRLGIGGTDACCQADAPRGRFAGCGWIVGSTVEDDSPASQAGLAQGDLIVLAGGKPVRGVDDLFEALGTAGGTIQLIILRGADERAVDVQLGASAGDQ